MTRIPSNPSVGSKGSYKISTDSIGRNSDRSSPLPSYHVEVLPSFYRNILLLNAIDIAIFLQAAMTAAMMTLMAFSKFGHKLQDPPYKKMTEKKFRCFPLVALDVWLPSLAKTQPIPVKPINRPMERSDKSILKSRPNTWES